MTKLLCSVKTGSNSKAVNVYRFRLLHVDVLIAYCGTVEFITYDMKNNSYSMNLFAHKLKKRHLLWSLK